MRTSRRTSVGLLSLIVAAAQGVAVAQDAPPGWTPAWSDEFNGTTLDAGRWEALNRKDSFNNEKQYYLPSQVSVANGQLDLTATNVPLAGKAYRSGLVRTWAEQTYGRWEVRASLPTGQGMWPAIWLLPRNVDWPRGGEIDIMENRGSQPTVVGNAYHYGPSVAGHQYVSRDFGYSVNGTPVSFHNSMHTYAVEWDAARIRYLTDGVPTYTFYRNTAPVSSSPMSLILNLAVGGDYGGDPNASTQFPGKMGVDWVRVYDRDAGTRALVNPSFEDRSGSLYQEWTEYSNGGGNVLTDAVAANARTGNSAVQMYGRFNGTNDNTSGLYQEFPTTPGEVWQVGAFAKNRPGDKLAGGNTGRVKLEFVDANGAVIDGGLLELVDAAAPTAYREGVVRRAAPANAVFVRAVLEMRQLNNAGGAVDFDDASLRRWTNASLPGDVNLDGLRDAADLDALHQSLKGPSPQFDFNGDASINAADVDALLAAAFVTRRGDADLDRDVDFNDLLALARNYNAAGTGRWALGDFDGDANVDFDDLLVLARNYNTSTNDPATTQAAQVSAAAFADDWALARALVPEPTAATTLLVAASGLAASALRRRARVHV